MKRPAVTLGTTEHVVDVLESSRRLGPHINLVPGAAGWMGTDNGDTNFRYKWAEKVAMAVSSNIETGTARLISYMFEVSTYYRTVILQII